ncbi:Do family serine endopeptidase [Motilimonas cestriensis]|uniref:Do family serine endopeptidase n=1 Tax=Motilimonas cestriensis TaxID=2742685 RepID=A0ABS8WFF3_9GAMM|nr:Do family serine endopeptidase [Motilimonas cestriensis]MCE2596075.1 Do family serine endopeptidase [Motilimonas cestriensis]
MKKPISIFTAVALSTALAFGSLSAQAAHPVAIQGQELPSLAPLLEEVSPAVVNISVAGTKVSRQSIPEPFRHFFGPDALAEGAKQPFRGLGSGVIIDAKKGYVITNYHVIHQADEIKVTLNNGKEYTAKKIGEDQQTDIALLQIEAKNLTAIKLANSDELRVGDFTIAIGNPFGLGQTVTSGIVSALGRSGLNIENYENFIQTDAAINSGNSGGALLNLRGELIGINTAILGPNGGNIGIGFAIPVNMVKNLSAQILEFGEVRRGLLGITGGELTPELAEAFGYDTQHGAFVNQVMADSAAEEAGLQAGDIIIKLNQQKIRSFNELRAKVATLGAGKEITLTLVRDGKEQDFKVTLQEAKDSNIAANSLHPALEGATLSSTDPKDKVQGVLISKVLPNSPAALAGLEEGDVIVGINRLRTKDMADLRKIIEDKPSVLALNIKRGNASLYRVIR